MEKETQLVVKKVYTIAQHVITGLGHGVEEHFDKMSQHSTGVQLHHNPSVVPEAFTAALIEEPYDFTSQRTRFEHYLIECVRKAMASAGLDAKDPSTLLIISTTKGNIDLMDGNYAGVDSSRLEFSEMAGFIQKQLKLEHEPIVVSNACISGVLSILWAKRYIERGQYKHVVVAGGDIVSKFTISGFQSFMALSDAPCKPFDANRNGLNLGEGFAALVLSSDKNDKSTEIVGGASSNDANHISGPSRTGDGLAIAIDKTLEGTSGIDFISAHGTATPFNDAMEAKAIELCGLQHVPVNSYKGYIGHTLGAAGVIETVLTIHGMEKNLMPGTLGFETLGVAPKIKVQANFQKGAFNAALKTASGFGGCNAAILIRKEGTCI